MKSGGGLKFSNKTHQKKKKNHHPNLEKVYHISHEKYVKYFCHHGMHIIM